MGVFGCRVRLSVDHGGAERPFGGVVGRLDAGVGGEGPQRGPDLEQVVGEHAVKAGAFAVAPGALEQRVELASGSARARV